MQHNSAPQRKFFSRFGNAECPHGEWLPWLGREFGWSERTARNFMQVAEVFGKSANFADLKELTIEPSALYLLSSSNGSETVREEAVKKAKETNRSLK